MKLYVKNMVCPRCVRAVEQVVKGLGLEPVDVRLGEVLVSGEPGPDKLSALREQLKELGFELLDDSRKQQMDRIKSIIIDRIHYRENEKFVFPDVLAEELHKDYSMLSKLFSETEGITIEQYVILQKIEKVKELLAYNEMNLNEISYKLHYSSAAHLSAQFKKVTGLTPTQFKSQGIHLRRSLHEVK